MQCNPVMKMFTDRFRSDCFEITPIPSMNEIYVASSHHSNNSDTVFYTQHCGGALQVDPRLTPGRPTLAFSA